MEILLGKTAGFCYGVRNAVAKSEEKLKVYGKICCLGELVHNKQVVEKLEKIGLKIIDKVEEADKKVIIRAHGIPKEIYDKAKKKNIEIFDFTCPNVLKIHKIAEEYSQRGYYIFLMGVKNHPEIIGIKGFSGDNSYLIENEEEIDNAIEKLEKSNTKKLLIISQTTFSLEKFNTYSQKIRNMIPNDIELEIKNTICNATKMRQEETDKISKQVDFMIIIGGKNSSNTKKLYEIAKKNCENTAIVETKDELDINNIKKFKKIGIMAGASTPDESINEVIAKIEVI